jgi:hypothetical protein
VKAGRKYYQAYSAKADRPPTTIVVSSNSRPCHAGSPISNPTLPKWTNVLLRKMLLRAQAEHISILIINFYTNNADNIYPISKTQILTNRSNYSRASIIRTSVIRPTAGKKKIVTGYCTFQLLVAILKYY